MHLFILTGATRGLGHRLALALLSPKHQLLTIARGNQGALAEAAAKAGAPIAQWREDLSQPEQAAARLEAWLAGFSPGDYSAATLINNAGLLGDIGSLAQASCASISAVLRVNLEAPMLLTSAFLRATEAWSAQRKILNISSGAGRHPIAGWTAYCASKAGLDHFSRTAALEEAGKPNGAKIVSLAPGVIDTAMQAQLRGASAEHFPEQARFIQLYERGELLCPQTAAEHVLAYLARTDFGAEPIADIRHP